MSRSWCVLVMAAACGREAAPPPVAPDPPLPDVVDLAPGVARAYLLEGQLTVGLDEPARSELAASGVRAMQTTTSVCFDPDGAVTVGMTRSSHVERYDQAVLRTLAGWRFRPYVQDGVAVAGCTTAVFTYRSDRTPTETPALPAPAIELPPGEVTAGFAPGETATVATGGLGILRVCRRTGHVEPAQLALVQRSGSALTDRALLAAPVVVAAEESDAGNVCFLRAELRPPPRDLDEPSSDFRPPAPMVSAAAFEALRVTGATQVVPGVVVRDALAQRGDPTLTAELAVCLDRAGRVTAVHVERSSGFLGYDVDLLNTAASAAYRPMRAGDTTVPVCGPIWFAYRP